MTPITAWSPTKIWTVDNHFGKPSLIQALMATAVEEKPEAPLPNRSFHHQLPLHPNPTNDSSAWTWEPGDKRIKLHACHGTVSRGFEPFLDGPALVGVAIWRHDRIFHQLIADGAATAPVDPSSSASPWSDASRLRELTEVIRFAEANSFNPSEVLSARSDYCYELASGDTILPELFSESFYEKGPLP